MANRVCGPRKSCGAGVELGAGDDAWLVGNAWAAAADVPEQTRRGLHTEAFRAAVVDVFAGQAESVVAQEGMGYPEQVDGECLLDGDQVGRQAAVDDLRRPPYAFQFGG